MSPNNAPAPRTSVESEEQLDELASRFSQFDFNEFESKYFGSASNEGNTRRTTVLVTFTPPFILGYFTGRLNSVQHYVVSNEDFSGRKKRTIVGPQYIYPHSDLVESLLRLYFTNLHPTLPILHRPSFERSVRQGQHLTDMQFGGVLLAVLAIGSRYSKDSRVFIDGDASLSAGWKFANQIWILRKLFDPRYTRFRCILLTLYALGLSVPQNSWLYLGIGIRCLHHRGVHRRKPDSHKWGPEDELWKRAFWSFIALERMAEEYDAEPPLEVDDDYWDQGFTQPLGKPSQLSYFVCELRLCEISADAMRRLYALKKSKRLMGWDSVEWEQRTVAHFDSIMNNFLDSIPLHLRWDPDRPPQGVFFDQSAILHVSYHYLLIAIHRPYIHRPKLVSTSLSICAQSARTILRTADIWFSKTQCLPVQTLIHPVFVSGLILILNMLAVKRAGLSIDNSKDLGLVTIAMEFLEVAESRYQPTGRILDILRAVWSSDTQPNNQLADTDAYESGAADTAALEFPSIFGSGLNEIYPHLGQSFAPIDVSSGPQPGMSIEQLLADAGTRPSMSIFEDELMAMWMAVPTDGAHIINGWETHMESGTVLDENWFSGFGAPQYKYLHANGTY
ncbi:fungal-specific transcription factor domain-containing protein [Mycena olivaceomarginata]|nr:fungal-specific transcription factor domain-containing protein [Mycena olivaceomarginata]